MGWKVKASQGVKNQCVSRLWAIVTWLGEKGVRSYMQRKTDRVFTFGYERHSNLVVTVAPEEHTVYVLLNSEQRKPVEWTVEYSLEST